MNKEFLGHAERHLRERLFELDEQHENCEVHSGKKISATKYVELEGKSGTSVQTRLRHKGSIGAMGSFIQDHQMQLQKAGQKNLGSLVAELSGTRVLDALVAAHRRGPTSLDFIQACSQVVMTENEHVVTVILQGIVRVAPLRISKVVRSQHVSSTTS